MITTKFSSSGKEKLFSEITTTYYELAKVHHPDHGGDQATFLQIHKGLVYPFDGLFYSGQVQSGRCIRIYLDDENKG